LKDDIAIALAELRSMEGRLQSVRFTNPSRVLNVMDQFLDCFYGLYTQTFEQLDPEDRDKVNERDDFKEGFMDGGILDFFEDPFVFVQNKDEEEENLQIEPNKTAQRALKHARKYREYLNNAGLTDMKTYETRAGHAYRESM